MEEFGENLDLCVLAGYYGSGKRGSKISSFLCGLRLDDENYPMKFWSFCKVGGGFTGGDLREIHHLTDGKWHKWDPKNPPREYMDIGHPKEMPDFWIKPSDSLVFEVKAAQVIASSDFRCSQTLRFPRFKTMRKDKTWKEGLSLAEFNTLRKEVNKTIEEKLQSTLAKKIKKPRTTSRPKIRLLEDDANKISLATVAMKDDIFHRKPFFVADDVRTPRCMTKRELEVLIKENGGIITQSSSTPSALVIADRKLAAVAGIISFKSTDIIRPEWVFDCIEAKRVLPLEPGDLYYGRPETFRLASRNADKYGDSYRRQTNVIQLRRILNAMSTGEKYDFSDDEMKQLMLNLIDIGSGPFKGLLFPKYVLYFDRPRLADINGLSKDTANSKKVRIEDDFDFLQTYVEFNGAEVESSPHALSLTHIIVHDGDKSRVSTLRMLMSARPRQVRILDSSWILRCWEEGTTLAVDNFQALK